MCQTGLIILCRNKTSAGSKVFFHQLLLLGIVCLAAFVRRKGKIQSLFLKLILKLTYLLFCVSAAISALWFLSRGPRELKLSTCALHTASSAPPHRPTSLVPTSSVSVIISPASSPVFMASVPVQFHPWPYSVHNHHWSCPASHLCCSGPARLSFSSLIMSRCPTCFPTPPLAWCCHDVDLCCQHKGLQLLLWVRKHWTTLLNTLICCLWCSRSPLWHKQPCTQHGIWCIIGDAEIHRRDHTVTGMNTLLKTILSRSQPWFRVWWYCWQLFWHFCLVLELVLL